MLTKRISSTLTSAASRNKACFSVLSANQEFPHLSFEARKPFPAKYEKTSLEGVRIVSGENNSPLVKLKVAVVGGSGVESFSQKGAAHFISQTGFCGGNNSFSGRRWISIFESMGASYTSFADREKIVFEIRGINGLAPNLLKCMSFLLSSGPSDDEFPALKAKAQLAYDAFSADPVAQLSEVIHEAAFGETSALGGSMYAANLDRLTYEDVMSYRNATFLRENIVIAAAGVSSSALSDMLKDTAFPYIPSNSDKPSEAPRSTFVGGEVRHRVDLSGKTHLAIAFNIPSGETGMAYQVLAEALKSRFTQNTICASPFVHSYSSGGLLGIRTAGCPESASKNLSAAIGELKALAGNPGEINGAKNVLALDGMYRVDRQCTGVLLNAALSNQAVSKAFDHRSVTAEAVSKAAANAIKSSPAYAVLGTTMGVPTLSAIQKNLA